MLSDPTFVSTHSRPKAAGSFCRSLFVGFEVSTHSRPKAAGFPAPKTRATHPSFNTQPPEGGCVFRRHRLRRWQVSTHSRPKAADSPVPLFHKFFKFQHTAARRRLRVWGRLKKLILSFNTQPPEGGCQRQNRKKTHQKRFQHTAARRRLAF